MSTRGEGFIERPSIQKRIESLVLNEKTWGYEDVISVASIANMQRRGGPKELWVVGGAVEVVLLAKAIKRWCDSRNLNIPHRLKKVQIRVVNGGVTDRLSFDSQHQIEAYVMKATMEDSMSRHRRQLFFGDVDSLQLLNYKSGRTKLSKAAMQEAVNNTIDTCVHEEMKSLEILPGTCWEHVWGLNVLSEGTRTVIGFLEDLSVSDYYNLLCMLGIVLS